MSKPKIVIIDPATDPRFTTGPIKLKPEDQAKLHFEDGGTLADYKDAAEFNYSAEDQQADVIEGKHRDHLLNLVAYIRREAAKNPVSVALVCVDSQDDIHFTWIDNGLTDAPDSDIFDVLDLYPIFLIVAEDEDGRYVYKSNLAINDTGNEGLLDAMLKGRKSCLA
jgi:hypothetical protein